MAELYPYLQNQLENWGKWRTLGIAGLSYASETQLARWIQYGIIPPDVAAMLRSPRYMGSEAAFIDRQIKDQLIGDRAKLSNVLWAEYVGKYGEGMDKAQKIVAAGCSEATYYKRLREAHEIVAGWLNCPVYKKKFG